MALVGEAEVTSDERQPIFCCSNIIDEAMKPLQNQEPLGRKSDRLSDASVQRPYRLNQLTCKVGNPVLVVADIDPLLADLLRQSEQDAVDRMKDIDRRWIASYGTCEGFLTGDNYSCLRCQWAGPHGLESYADNPTEKCGLSLPMTKTWLDHDRPGDVSGGLIIVSKAEREFHER